MPLSPEQGHYLRTVLRQREGARLALFNGRDGEWLAEITHLERHHAEAVPRSGLRPQTPEPGPWLLFAPVKRQRLDFLVQKAVELGVSAVAPVFTRRTIVSRVNEERLRANMIEAAEQCERLTLPALHPACTLEASLAAWPPERRLLVAQERGTPQPLAIFLSGQGAGPEPEPESRRADSLAVLIGPEGGFDASELDALAKLPFVTPVGLGPRVLRSDTAALAALAVIQALAGDGAETPPPGTAGLPPGRDMD